MKIELKIEVPDEEVAKQFERHQKFCVEEAVEPFPGLDEYKQQLLDEVMTAASGVLDESTVTGSVVRDVRTLGGSIVGPGGPHSTGGFVIDTRSAVNMDFFEVAAILAGTQRRDHALDRPRERDGRDWSRRWCHGRDLADPRLVRADRRRVQGAADGASAGAALRGQLCPVAVRS